MADMTEGLSPGDPSSYSQPELVITKFLHLSLTIDFAREVLSGSVKIKCTKVVPDAKELILDIKDLTIFYIHDTCTGVKLDYQIGDPFKDIGAKLTINIEKSANDFEVTIGYETSPSAAGLQWLTPAQTAGKVYPFMFSQGQPTEMRSIIPCQDTPKVKVPYTADIRAPKDLTVLMSALRSTTTLDMLDGTKIHQFNQPVVMPSYLIAICAGQLEFRNLGPRSNVWAEPSVVEKAQNEFTDTETFLKTAESICGPYVWGQYDLLVLPPSFPYGGMENPCLTFVTPTVLAGDRSLVSVIAHEIAHSWTGNLITNANFNHFWLNEGFTVYVERKILGKMYGAKYRDFSSLVGLTELKDQILRMGENNTLTNLVVDLGTQHPNEAFSIVPYEKGSLFLRYLEQLVGGEEIFEKFLKDYLKTFQYQSIVTDDFKNHFIKSFPLVQVQWDSWLFTPGLPIVIPEMDGSMINDVNLLSKEWIALKNFDSGLPKKTILTTKQMVQFLNELLVAEGISVSLLKSLNEVYGLDQSENSEVKSKWLRLSIQTGWVEKVDKALEFVNSLGRMKFLEPIYGALYNAGGEIRTRAIANYKQHKDEMMVTAQKLVEKTLKLA